MSLRLAIFASLVGMAFSATTTTPSPSETLSTPATSASLPTLTSTTLTKPTTMATSTKSKPKTTTTSTTTSSTISAPPTSSTPPPTTTATTSKPPARTISIAVGESGLSFTPNIMSAGVGDVLLFSFYPGNHSVALGTWDKGCAPAADDGFFSGFIPVGEDESNLATFHVTVRTSDPFVFYCSAGRHCQNGMFGVVNPVTSDNSSEAGNHNLAAYSVLAKNASSNVSPPAVAGGTLAFNGTTLNGTTNGTVCGSNSANITSASTWCIPFIPNISSGSAAVERSIWAVMAVAVAVCLV